MRIEKQKKADNNKRYFVILASIAGLWCIYYIYFYNFYLDVSELLTEGAKSEVNILEMFYFRGTKLTIVLTFFFILVCIHSFFIQYVRIRESLEESKSKFNLINILLFVIFLVVSYLNVLNAILIVLTIISLTINHIIYVVSKLKYNYYDGELIFEKNKITSKEIAEKILQQELEKNRKLFKNNKFILVGDVVVDEDNLYRVEISVEES